MQNKLALKIKVHMRDFLVKWFAKKANRRTPNKNRISVIKYDGLGDFILFLDFAKGLRKLYPNRTIALSCSPEAKQIAESSGYFDEIICFTKQEFELKNLKQTAKKAQNLDCDILLHPTVSRDYYAEVVALFIKANVKYSVYNEHSFPEKINHWIEKQYDHIFDVGKYKMALEQNATFIRLLGLTDFKSSMPVLTVDNSCHLCLPKDFFVLFVGGSKWDKIWLEERFCEVAKWISEKTKWECVVCGVQADKPVESFLSKNDLTFVSYIGKTTISELIYIISKSKFVFGNDTSAIHMAAALNVPSLCVRSAVSLNRFYPYVVDNLYDENILPVAVGVNPECQGCSLDGEFRSCRKNPIVEGKMNCISAVTSEMVLCEIKMLLERRNLI